MYLVEGQDLFLLFRSVSVGAVIQSKGKVANRAYVINSGLRNSAGELVGYLMGLYKYKCNARPIWSDVFHLEEGKLVVFTKITDLYGFFCDTTVEIPLEAITAHKQYIECKRWYECGVYDDKGVMKNNNFINFQEARAPLPQDDEPGMLLYGSILYVFYTTIQ